MTPEQSIDAAIAELSEAAARINKRAQAAKRKRRRAIVRQVIWVAFVLSAIVGALMFLAAQV